MDIVLSQLLQEAVKKIRAILLILSEWSYWVYGLLGLLGLAEGFARRSNKEIGILMNSAPSGVQAKHKYRKS